MATQTLSNDDIIEAIGNLSVVELAELIEKFKEKFGVTIAAPVAAAPAAGGRGLPALDSRSSLVDDMREFATLLLACTSPSVHPRPASRPGAAGPFAFA